MIPCVVEIRGTVYPSQKAAAAALGISTSCISSALYKRGDCDRVGLGPDLLGNTNARARAVSIFNLRFRSVKKASEALGVSRQTIRRFLSPTCLPSTYQLVYAAVLAREAKAEAAARKARAQDG